MAQAGRPPTSKDWELRVFNLRGRENLSAQEIEKRFEAEAKQKEGMADYPSLSVIRKFVTKFNKLTPDEQQEYRLFSWPQSMGTPDLPWEASRTMLNLLAYLHHNDLPRPLNKVATWFWRLSLAAPDAGENQYDQHIRYLLVLAGHMALLEFQGKLSQYEETAPLQWVLSYATWRSEDATKRYATALFRDRMQGPRPVHEHAEPIEMPRLYGSFSGNLNTVGAELETVLGYTVGAELATALDYAGPEELEATAIAILKKASDEAVSEATERLRRTLPIDTGAMNLDELSKFYGQQPDTKEQTYEEGSK